MELHKQSVSLSFIAAQFRSSLDEMLSVATEIEDIVQRKQAAFDQIGGLDKAKENLDNHELEESGRLIQEQFTITYLYARVGRQLSIGLLYAALEHHYHKLFELLCEKTGTSPDDAPARETSSVLRPFVRLYRCVCGKASKPRQADRGITRTRNLMRDRLSLPEPANQGWAELVNIGRIRNALMHNFGRVRDPKSKLYRYVDGSPHFDVGFLGEILPESTSIEYVHGLVLSLLEDSVQSAIELYPALGPLTQTDGKSINDGGNDGCI